MVQEFQVLRCYSCQVFQVHQVKKSKKWLCKLCGEKQSLLKVYGQGSGADCRHHVQKLNLLRGQVEQVTTSTAGDIYQNDMSDDDTGDETKQSHMDSQEGTAISRWNKYLEENNDDACEEKDLTSADPEHHYSHQDCAPTSVRKRRREPYDGGNIYREDATENISKKNKIYEGGSPSESEQISCQTTEDMGCLTPDPHTFPQQTNSAAVYPMNSLQGHFTKSSYITAGLLKRDTTMGHICNHSDHSKKIGPDYSVTRSKGVLPNNESSTTNVLSVQKCSPPGLAQSSLGNTDQPIKTSSLVSLPKPFIQSDLFQTDEDFDDNY